MNLSSSFFISALSFLLALSCSSEQENHPSNEAGGAGPEQSSQDCERIVPKASSSSCFNAACEQEACGASHSIYAENGCLKLCSTDSDCIEGESCEEREYAPVRCDGEEPCRCGNLTIISTKKVCGPV